MDDLLVGLPGFIEFAELFFNAWILIGVGSEDLVGNGLVDVEFIALELVHRVVGTGVQVDVDSEFGRLKVACVEFKHLAEQPDQVTGYVGIRLNIGDDHEDYGVRADSSFVNIVAADGLDHHLEQDSQLLQPRHQTQVV